MTKPRILVAPPIPSELRLTLEAAFELVEYQKGEAYPEFRVLVITSAGGADKALMDALPGLGLIACNGTGIERVDLIEAARRGIIVRNTPDEVTDDTADFAMALIYAVSRRLAEADRFVRSGRWAKERLPPSQRVYGQRIGIVGLGRIGAKIAERATGAGMNVSYTGPREKPNYSYTYLSELRALAFSVDTLVLSVPGGERTRGIIDADILRALGPGGRLVNVSRGAVVDEAALLDALERKTIAGAGLDVFNHEPHIDPRFFALDNVVLAPHYAAVTQETRQAIAHSLYDAITDFWDGRPVMDVAAAHVH